MIKSANRTIQLIACLVLALCPSSLMADDTIVADFGKTVSPQVSNDISMTEEVVEISLHDQVDKKKSVFPLRKAHVKCLFKFTNSSDMFVEATVGFPGDLPAYGDYSEPLADFVAIVDGRPQAVSVREEQVAGSKDAPPQQVRNWYTWSMKFPPKSVVMVENRYDHTLSAPPGYDPFYLTYELSTGANWKGPIGKATVRVIYGSVAELEQRVCGIEPPLWRRDQNSIVWQFQDMEPTKRDNIRVCEWNLGVDIPESQRKQLLFKTK